VTSSYNGNFGSAPPSLFLRTLLMCGLLMLSAVSLVADSRAVLHKAASLVQEGRLDEAEQQARLALADPAARGVAYSVLGTIRIQQRRIPESVIFLEKAIRLEPRLVGAHLSLAQAYELEQKPEQALSVYQTVVRLDPSNASARLALARAETEKGNYQQSLALARPVLADFKQSPDGLYLLAADYLKTGGRDSAAALATDWMRLSDVSQDWSMKFALLLAREGVIEQAIDILQHAKQSGSSYELEFNLGGVYLLKNDAGHALESYDRALRFSSDSLPALRQAATLAEHQGELERSLSYWIRAKKLATEDPDVLLGFGRVCLKMDLLEDAEPALTKAASMRPNEPAYQYALASAKVGKKQFEAAEQLLEELVQKQPTDSQLQYALGSVLYLEGHLPEAATHLEESARLQPQQFASYYYLALVARDQGKDAEALQLLEKLLKDYPDHGPSNEVFGELLMSAQRYPEAESALRKAVRLDPKSVKANYQLGLLLARMGKKEEADKQLAMAKTLRTEDATNSRLQLRLLDPDK
jgi:tetratricopeptide (TPR) repeat protein